ncbi:hypothetical protein F5141DRAFT_147162 [Pisolithus sp. B1]|nr:hypothetical protein F5141DRAFT_147162 [Pisolithus sp. B1]
MPKEFLRSESREDDLDSEIGSPADHESQSGQNYGPNKPGRKKNPNSQAARRDQNRIAQREFRLRKQQKIRDLEARVQLLSASQDEALTDLRAILKDLMAENLTLRNLLKNVAGFIGEGAGGVMEQLGYRAHDFEALLNKSETDTAWESFQRRKGASKTAQSTESTSSSLGLHTGSSKRPSEDSVMSSQSKKLRGMGGSDNPAERDEAYPLIIPMSTTVPPPPPPAATLYPPPARSPQENIFSDLMRNGHASSSVFIPPTPSATPVHYPTPSSSSGYTYLPQMSMVDQGMSTMSFSSSKNGIVRAQSRVLPQTNATSEEPDDDEELEDSKRVEAMKLIRYHLDNYARNNNYCLPPSLRPTFVQKTMNHESVIDRIIHPELRDRVILLRGQFSLADCLYDYKKAIRIHGDDVLAHSNWELSEQWLQKYSYLVGDATLDICNRWRRERGEVELKLPAVGAQGESPS